MILILTPLIASGILIIVAQGSPKNLQSIPTPNQNGLLKLNNIGGPTFSFLVTNSSQLNVLRGREAIGEFSLNVIVAEPIRFFYDDICNCSQSFAKSISVRVNVNQESYLLEGSNLPGGYTNSSNPLVSTTLGTLNVDYSIKVPISANVGLQRVIIVCVSFNSYGNHTDFLENYPVILNVQ